jgi:predicted Zn-dependent protease
MTDANAEADKLAQLRGLCGGPRDGTLLRVSIANILLKRSEIAAAIEQLRAALRFDPDYSAAWKLFGKTLAENGEVDAAREAYRAGIEAAIKRGDKQAGKEMTVFLRRLKK